MLKIKNDWFNIYFCIKQGKNTTLSTLRLVLDVRQLTSSLKYYPGNNLFILQLSMTENISVFTPQN